MESIIYSVSKDNIESNEIIELYDAMGWGKKSDYTLETMDKVIQNTSFIVSVRNSHNTLIGIARILSDDVLHTHIAEIGVHPLHRRQGIGTAVMELIKQRYNHTSIYFDTFKDNEEFFANLGYRKQNMTVFSRNFSK